MQTKIQGTQHLPARDAMLCHAMLQCYRAAHCLGSLWHRSAAASKSIVYGTPIVSLPGLTAVVASSSLKYPPAIRPAREVAWCWSLAPSLKWHMKARCCSSCLTPSSRPLSAQRSYSSPPAHSSITSVLAPKRCLEVSAVLEYASPAPPAKVVSKGHPQGVLSILAGRAVSDAVWWYFGPGVRPEPWL